MSFPSMNRSRSYRIAIPQLSGGINYAQPPHRIADNQLADAVNVWWRHGQLKTRPALQGVSALSTTSSFHNQSLGSLGCLLSDSEKSGGAYATLIDESGSTTTYHYPGDTQVKLFAAAVNNEAPDSLSDEQAILFLHGKKSGGIFGLADGAFHSLSPYIPTVLINGRPQSVPTRHVVGDLMEPYNLLTDEYRCTFTPDGENKHYFLPTVGDTVLDVLYCGSIRGTYGEEPHTLAYDADTGLYLDTASSHASGYLAAYSPLDGHFWFYECLPDGMVSTPNPQVPVALPEGNDNTVAVHVLRTDADAAVRRNTILQMRFSVWFGGGTGLAGGTRLFVSGNPQHPNLVHWSALNNPLYFPENNYAYVGSETGAVTAFGKQSDMLVVFKENELYYTTYHQGNSVSADDIESGSVVDTEAVAAYFPFVQIHPEIGCDCPNTVQLCHNRLVWLHSDGCVYGLFSSGAYNERNVRRLSFSLGDALHNYTRDELRTASAVRYDEQYLLLIGKNRLFAMDYSSYGFAYYNSYSSDERAQRQVIWHLWETNICLLSLLRVGDTAFLIGSDSENRRCLFKFNEQSACDEQLTVTDTTVGFSATAPIAIRLCTKHFDFDAPERFKRIQALFLQVSGTQGDTVALTFHDGTASHSNTALLPLDGTPPERTAPMRVHPNLIRVRQCGIQLACNGALSVGSLSLHYSTMGVIR